MAGDGGPLPRTLVCPTCGRANHDTARFCQACAADLTGAAGPPGTPPAEDASGIPPDGPADGRETPPWYRRTPIVVAVIVGALLLVAGIAWLTTTSGDGDGTDTTTPPTTTAVTASGTATTAAGPGTTVAPQTTAPPTTPAPAPLVAPVLTSVTPTCDPAADPEAPCTIVVTWEHPGGADGFTVVATVQNGPAAGNSWVDAVGPDVRSAQIGPLATGLEECVKVIADRAGTNGASSPEQCVSTGIG